MVFSIYKNTFLILKMFPLLLTINQSFPLLEDDLFVLGYGRVLLLSGGIDGSHSGLTLEHEVALQEVTLVHLAEKHRQA